MVAGRSVEVLVVGAGIVGVSAARELAEAGVDVAVVDPGPIAGAASGLNAGVISGGGWGREPDVDVMLKMRSRERYVELADERGHDIGLDITGTLTFIRTDEEWAWAATVVEAERAAGRAAELLGADELAAAEPAADPTLLGAVFDPLGARAEPVAATLAIATDAEAAGARIENGVAVDALEPTGSGAWEGVTADGRIGADAVVVAAGPWCAELLGRAPLGLTVPIVAVRGQMWASAPRPPLLRHAIAAAESATAWTAEGAGAPGTEPDPDLPPALTHVGGRRVTRHLYGRQRPNGEIVFGGDRVLVDVVATPGPVAPDPEGIVVNHEHVAELLPAIADTPTVRTWAGLMPFSLDGRPLIGPIPDHPGLFLAGGLASSGFGRGPASGALVARLVLGADPGVDHATVAPAGRVTAR